MLFAGGRGSRKRKPFEGRARKNKDQGSAATRENREDHSKRKPALARLEVVLGQELLHWGTPTKWGPPLQFSGHLHPRPSPRTV